MEREGSLPSKACFGGQKDTGWKNWWLAVLYPTVFAVQTLWPFVLLIDVVFCCERLLWSAIRED